ncbi:hypothetical protein TRVA0_024S00716 [Trichomonascus vanleenenianus]|uniref:uncharacterized protein n=1 Tax=Trichomonascus vanleenenianus TaxID=2268995 RepID=UPI003ECB351C
MQRPKGKKKAKAVPVTASDHLDAGIEEEEGGDRWISSGDVAKGVRFYQRAYRLYKRAVELATPSDQEVKQDARYNVARMQFLIYSKVVQTHYLPVIASELEPEPSGDGVVIQDIASIVASHEEAVAQYSSPEDCPIDLLYNYAQVLVEAGEETSSAEYFYKASEAFKTVIQRQVAQIKEIAASEPIPEASQNTEPDEKSGDITEKVDKSEDITSTGVNFGPLALADSLTNYLGAVTKSVETIQEAVANPEDIIGQLNEVIEQFNEELTPEAVDEARIAVAQSLSAARINSGNVPSQSDLEEIWSQPWLPQSAARFMAQADALMDLAEASNSGDAAWAAYSAASKVIQQGLGLNQLTPVSKARLWVAKGDLDVLRSRLDTPAAARNGPVLAKNAAVYYTNALNLQVLGSSFELDLAKREANAKRAFITRDRELATHELALVRDFE